MRRQRRLASGKRIVWSSVLLLSALVIVVLVLGPPFVDKRRNTVAVQGPLTVSRAARELHAGLAIADLHNDLLLWWRDPLRRYRRGHSDLPRLLEANVALQVFGVVTHVPWGMNYEANTAQSDLITPLAVLQAWPPATWGSVRARALFQADRLRRSATRSHGQLRIIRDRGDLQALLRARRRGEAVVGAVLALEGMHALEGALANIEVFYAAGYRLLGLAHFFDNAFAGSAHGATRHGLTPLGRQALARMQALNMIVDLAHASRDTMDDALATTAGAMLVSHTGVAATCPGPRNLSDAQVRAVAAGGGLVGIGLWPGALCETTPAGFVRAVRHVVDLVGIDHVALGSDFDGATQVHRDVTGLVEITQTLLQDGFTEADIARILGGNTIDFLSANLPASGDRR